MRIKDAFKLSPFWNTIQPWRELILLRRWLQTPQSMLVPQAIKRSILFSLARERKINVLVETGTYLGDTVAYGLQSFKEVHSIEVDRRLHERAKRLFGNRPGAFLHIGDSGGILPKIVAELEEPAVFWLDGHFSSHVTGRGHEDTPIEKEVRTVLESPFLHVAVIDDARMFGTDPAYPTLDRVRDIQTRLRPGYGFFVVADVIVIGPCGVANDIA
jgi:hypothetical protein